jgi:Nitrate and nitrite sensing/ANTAR domain
MGGKRDRVASGVAETPSARFLRSAKLCRIRDLEQLLTLSELLKTIGELVHALQKERGASSIFLGSKGELFGEELAGRVANCLDPERSMCERLGRVDETFDRISSGARLYTRVVLAFRALDALPGLREQVRSLGVAPQDAVRAFTWIIGCFLAVMFEVANVACDPAISRALVALVSFAQGKEYAGQERATAAVGFSRGSFDAAEYRRLQNLVAAQERAFRIFSEFADPAHIADFNAIVVDRNSAEVRRLRAIAFVGGRVGELAGVTANEWFEQTTRRIDAMKPIEEHLTADLKRLCSEKLDEACKLGRQADPRGTDEMVGNVAATAPFVIVVTDVDPALNNFGMDGGVGLFSLDAAQPGPMQPILEVIQAQSRRIDAVSSELESARLALAERKVIERAKALLMRSRRLSETAAYALMRETAMSQNKRIFEVAEAVVGMAEILEA